MSRPARSSLSALTLASSASVVAMLPVFLVGALAVQLTEDLAFGAAGLGGAVAVYRGASALSSGHLGRVTDRLGASMATRLSALAAVVCGFGMAFATVGWFTLSLWLAFGGLSHAIGQPAANRLIANNVPTARRGLAFGIKQSAAPLASMLAGLSVPLLALTIGWRWNMALVGVFGLVLAFGIRAPSRPRQRRTATSSGNGELPRFAVTVLFATAFGVGTATSSAGTTFFVSSAADAGMASGSAGTAFAVASIVSIASRVGCGRACDRMAGGHLNLCGGLLAVGALGFLLMATGDLMWMTVGVMLALAGSWGFNGVFWFAMVRAFPRAPGAITGRVLPGATLGAMLGPLGFGAFVEVVPYATGWIVVAVLALVATAVMRIADRALVRSSPAVD